MTSQRVDEAMRAVARTDFLPRRLRKQARYDGPLPIGFGQTNSQPRTVADMLELLDPRPGDRVLDVGSGSGWSTALLAHLVGPTGSVIGVEIVADLAVWGAANLAAAGMSWASIRQASPDVLGAPDEGPYDRVLVSAEAHDLPQALVEQLAPGGRMVIPVRGRMVVVERVGDEIRHTEHGYYRFVPLL